MAWTDRYWDLVREFYWVPSYLGLKSIPQKHWVVSESTVTVPKSMTNPTGPLYRRLRTESEYWPYVRRQEETFNHVLNLGLAVMPGDVVCELFRPFTGVSGQHDYELQGALGPDHPWLAGKNVTSPDCFLVSPQALLALEIKFNATTSLDQLAKYVALIASEELYRGARDSVNLLYIFPAHGEEKFLRATAIEPRELAPRHFEILQAAVSNRHVHAFYAERRSAIEETLERLRISCMTWRQLADRLTAYAATLGASPGDRTLARLLDGLGSEICAHPLSGVTALDACAGAPPSHPR